MPGFALRRGDEGVSDIGSSAIALVLVYLVAKGRIALSWSSGIPHVVSRMQPLLDFCFSFVNFISANFASS
jgi:hypothetical protein